jgi:hypothetical protein
LKFFAYVFDRFQIGGTQFIVQTRKVSKMIIHGAHLLNPTNVSARMLKNINYNLAAK